MVYEKDKYCYNCGLPSIVGGRCTVCGKAIEESKQKKYDEVLAPETILQGRYLIGRVLGYGGFGITYVAVDLEGNKRIAIKECFYAAGCSRSENNRKVILKSQKYENEFQDAKERFFKEATLLKENSDNPGIIQIYQIFEENDTVYYTMEFLEGSDLKTYLENHNNVLPWQELKDLMEPIFNSLISLHRFNIWHRDISPDNIFICKNGEVRLIDFGSAKVGLRVESHELDVAKNGYAPIEQFNKNYEQGTWSDVYSMAATVYRCLTGVVLPSAAERYRRDQYVAASKYALNIQEYIDDALEKALAVEPQYRFQSMVEFKYALYKETNTIPLADRIVELPSEEQKQEEEKKLNVHLLGLEGYHKGKSIPLTTNVIMGRRGDACNVIFPDYMPGVSGIHCSIRWDADKKLCVFRDLNSTYGSRDLGRNEYQKAVDYYLGEGEGFTIGDDNTFVILYSD